MTGYLSGQTVQMKKPHPCGNYQWEIIKSGMYFHIRCKGCGHRVEMRRDAFEKAVKRIISDDLSNE